MTSIHRRAHFWTICQMVGAGAPCDNCLLLRVGDESDGWVPVGCEDTVTPPPADAMAQVVNTRGRRIAIARAETYEGTSPLCVVCYEAVFHLTGIYF